VIPLYDPSSAYPFYFLFSKCIFLFFVFCFVCLMFHFLSNNFFNFLVLIAIKKKKKKKNLVGRVIAYN
jgi:hypothetical protein